MKPVSVQMENLTCGLGEPHGHAAYQTQGLGSEILVVSLRAVFYVSNHFSLEPHDVWFV